MFLIRATCCLLVLLAGNAAWARMPVVLIIESYHPVLEWTAQCEKGIRLALGPGYDVRSFFMDTKRVPEKEFPARAEEAWKVMLSTRPDLVMLGDDNALSMLGERIAKTGKPLVYFGINNNPRRYFEHLPPNVAGVLERTPVIPWLRHLANVLPQASRVLVLLDRSLTSDSIVAQVFQGHRILRVSGLSVEYHVAADWKDWQEKAAGAGAFDFILTPTFHALRSADGYVDIETVVTWTAAHSPVPVFSNQDYTVGRAGFAGALVLVGTEHGRLAGEMAREILQGGLLPQEVQHRTDKDGQFYFSRTQLARFAITLPPDIEAKAVFKD